jgi:WD40 repeat protein/mono/diheme cytochrome c family protein
MSFRAFAFALVVAPVAVPAFAEEAAAPAAVSYYKQIRPIFQANCQGCHQPAKANGEYVMTAFDRLAKGGESGEAAIVAGKPDESHLLGEITPKDGKAEMPKGKPPLADVEIQLIRKWIEEGAKDDTPSNAVQRYDAEHPPVYTRLPVVTAIDYSPDGQLLAIAGFHEVLLQKADGSGLVGRLVGVSERIESVRFSPDGKKLSVAGGLPCRMGELQIWDVEKKSLELSVPVTFDTIYGASWSPDGTKVAVGCADKTVRAFDVATGTQIFFNGAHDDWAVDTTFGIDGKHIVSVGRDMAAKLYETETQRFVDNITSITPGALKGGLQAVARHPSRDNVLLGSSDGIPRIYRTERVTTRVIGDDANLIRRYPPIPGRIFAVDFAPDGKTIAVGSALDGKGWVYTYSSDYDDMMPDEIKGIVQKVVGGQSAEELKKLEEYVTKDVKLLTQTELPTAVYAMSYSPDGKTIAVSGGDGKLRRIDATNGTVSGEFPVIDVNAGSQAAPVEAPAAPAVAQSEASAVETLPPGTEVASLAVSPEAIELTGPYAYVQVLVTAKLNNGDTVDVTRLSKYQPAGAAKINVTPAGMVTCAGNGGGSLQISAFGKTVEVPVTIEGFEQSKPLSFIEDVNPVLSKIGCNQGTCHGAKEGKNGFKLSLRGYDAIFDIRALTDDHASRRVNVASPDDSLMLLKSTGAAPHVGGQLIKPGDPYYSIIRRWIAEGANLNLADSKPTKIDVLPTNPVVQMLGSKQQVRVVATYPDGHRRDVTREVFIESGNTDVASTTSTGLITVLRRGEAPVLARYDGAYAATTVTAMGDRNGFAWQEQPAWSEVDRLVAGKWKRLKILPSDLCNDYEFIRRVTLDMTGLPPTPEDVRAFVADPRDTRIKRNALIDQLVGSEGFIVYWTNKWADMLQVNGKFLAREGATAFRAWIRNEVSNNTPYDQFAFKVLDASGSNKDNPAASYFKILREPDLMMENTTHLFLGVRFNCNKCHDHPFERWTQDQYYQTTAYFSRVGLDRDPASEARTIGGTAVEGAKPLYEIVVDRPQGETKHLRTGNVVTPTFPYPADHPSSPEMSRREELARWITSPDNQYFAKSYVNRIWGYLMGAGLIEPLDDIRAGNPASNPELLDWLTKDFIAHGFDVRHLMKTISKSRVYQLSIATNDWNQDDAQNYSHALARRLPAEVLFDSIHQVTGSASHIPGMAVGMRAAALPDSEISTTDGFLANLGRPVRESACECERVNDLQLGPVMALMSGPTVGDSLSDQTNVIAKLVADNPDNAKLVDELSMRILNRPAPAEEINAATAAMQQLDVEHQELVADLAKYEQDFAPVLAEREAKRQGQIAAAQKAHDDYAASIKAREDAAEAERQAKIAAAQAEVNAYEAALPQKSAEWLASATAQPTAWAPVVVDPARSTNGTGGGAIEVMDDKSVFVSGMSNKKGEYVLTAETDLTGVTGFKIEALTDSRLPGMGPGRAPNGNFVITEFEVEIAPKSAPDQKTKVELQNAKADYSQGGFDVGQAIDGQHPEGVNGWAIHDQMGKSHSAVFECKAPAGHEGGSILTIKIDQKYSDNLHTIGRFRISMTKSAAPLQFGLPENIVQIAQIAADQRNDEQKKAVAEFFKAQDGEFKAKAAALAEAQKPRPEDPQLVSLRAALADSQKPLPMDPQLARLKRAVDLSSQQLGSKRLTVAQDYAWALINSPAFLFNR